MTYKIKKSKQRMFHVSSTRMVYSFNIKARNKPEAERKFRKMFKNTLTGEEEVVFD